jgi:phage shock protein PspC (stress-responsive transcriptional regulator)
MYFGRCYFGILFLILRYNLIDMYKIKYFVENQAFGVCTRLGEKFKISTSSIRLYFIYTSFLTMGSPIIVYLILAFWMNIRRYLRQRNNPSVWDI